MMNTSTEKCSRPMQVWRYFIVPRHRTLTNLQSRADALQALTWIEGDQKIADNHRASKHHTGLLTRQHWCDERLLLHWCHPKLHQPLTEDWAHEGLQMLPMVPTTARRADVRNGYELLQQLLAKIKIKSTLHTSCVKKLWMFVLDLSIFDFRFSIFRYTKHKVCPCVVHTHLNNHDDSWRTTLDYNS